MASKSSIGFSREALSAIIDPDVSSVIENKPLRGSTDSIRDGYAFSLIRFADQYRVTFPHILERVFAKAIPRIQDLQNSSEIMAYVFIPLPLSIVRNSLQESTQVKKGKIQQQTVAKIVETASELYLKQFPVTKGSHGKDARSDLLPNDHFFIKIKKSEEKTLLYLDLRFMDKLDRQRTEGLALLVEEFLELKQATLPDDSFVDLQAKKRELQGISELLLRLVPTASHIFGSAGQFVQSTMADRMRFEAFRLGSFVHLNDVDHPTAIRLANAGFFFAFEGRVMQCYSCGHRWEDWQPEQNPYDQSRHRADCKHIQGRDEGNVPIHPRQTSFQSGTDITGDASTDNSVAETCSKSRHALQESFDKFTDDIARCGSSAPTLPRGNEGDSRRRTNTPEDVSVLAQATETLGVTSASVSPPSVKSNADDYDYRSRANDDVPHDNNSQLRSQETERASGLRTAHANDPQLFAQGGHGAGNAGFPLPTTHFGGSERTSPNPLSSNWNPSAARDTHPPTLPQTLQESHESLNVADRTTDQRQHTGDQRAFGNYNGWMERQIVNTFTEDLVGARSNATEASPRSDSDRDVLARGLPAGHFHRQYSVYSAEAGLPNLSHGPYNRQNVYENHLSYSSSAQSTLSAGNVSNRIAGYADNWGSSHVNNIAGSSTHLSTSDLPISASELPSGVTDRRLGEAQSEETGSPGYSNVSQPSGNRAGLPASTVTLPSLSTNESTSPVSQTASTSDSAASQPQPSGATGGSASFHPEGAVYPGYAERNSRMESFRHWPPHLTQTPEELADCGFYYTGTEDCVRCFYCGLGLKHWDQGDDPEEEHERWRGTCAFLRFRREQEVAAWRRALSADVQHVNSTSQHSSHQNEGETNSASGGSSNLPRSGQAARASRGVQDSNWMASRPAQAARDMGFHDDVIQDAILALLETRAGPRAVTSQNLINAILYLRESPEQGRQSPDWRHGLRDPQDPRGLDNLRVSSSESGDSRDDDEISNDPEPPTEVGTGPRSCDVTAHVINAAGTGHCNEGKLRSSNDDVICSNSNADETSPSNENLNQDMLRQLEAENKELLERRRCKICLDQDINVLLMPCAHRVCCADCVLRLRRCPMCRTRIQSVVLVR